MPCSSRSLPRGDPAHPRPAPRTDADPAGRSRDAVSAVVVSWNARAHVAQCLLSLAPAGVPVIVVDNASGDGTAELVAREFPWVQLDRASRNLGFAGAVNRGVALSSTSFVLLLNPDVEATPEAIDTLAEFLGRHPAHAAVGGCLIDGRGQPQRGFNVRRLPTLASLVLEILLLDALWPTNPITRRYLARDTSFEAPADVEQPAAACLLLRRQAFDEIRGMDERFTPAWFEDVDLCRRLRSAGWRIAFEPRARFRHEGKVAMRTLGLTAFSLIFYRNLERYVRKHFGALAAGAIRLTIVAGMGLRGLISAARLDWSAVRAYATVGWSAAIGWRIRPRSPG